MASVDQLFAKARASFERRDFMGARLICQEILKKAPGHAETLLVAGSSCLESGAFDEAIGFYKRCIPLRPKAPQPYYNIGVALMGSGRTVEAEEWLRKAVNMGPNWENSLNNLALCLRAQNRLDEAAEMYRRAVELNPKMHAAVFGFASAMLDQGRPHDAAKWYRQAMELHSREPASRANYLLALNYADNDPELVREAHRSVGAWYESNHPRSGPHTNSRDPERKLRIGFLSPDFREHSCAYFMEPLLERLDRSRFDVVCYSAAPENDHVTARFRNMAQGWRSLDKVDAAAAAGMIREDGIDILFDMTAYTGGSRLDVMARKPAPVQITYLGYPNTTGLSTMDYRLVDWVSDPQGSESHCVEKLLRVPEGRCVWCYRPSSEAPPVSEAPYKKSGIFTFGSFNNSSKVTSDVLAAWAEILVAAPGSRLFLKNRWLHDPGTREKYLSALETHGVSRDRVEVAPYTKGTVEHLAMYERIDLQLDTFPYNGTTTTCESLWQGVPVVTFGGRVHAARVGASLMRAAGLGEFVAPDLKGYIQTGAMWASRGEELAAMRASMRARLTSSVLMDEAGFAQSVGVLLRDVWRSWCAGGA